jgi:hypothetical protein
LRPGAYVKPGIAGLDRFHHDRVTNLLELLHEVGRCLRRRRERKDKALPIDVKDSRVVGLAGRLIPAAAP